MIRKREHSIIITTTSSIEGWEIQEYLGIISSHVVAGTNIFSDIFAEFRDVFGGRSASYQRQLSAIHEEAVELLKQKAILLGANWIVGLRIDHDEISGKAKSMFMITAVGTAVKATRIKTHQDIGYEKNRFLDVNEIEVLLKKKEIIRLAQCGDLKFDDNTWNFITEHQVHEIAPFILKEIQKISSNPTPHQEERLLAQQNFIQRSKEYFLQLPEDIAKTILYDSILNKGSTFNFARNIIEEANLLDFRQIERLFDSNNFEIQKQAVSLLKFDKSLYTPKDLEDFSNLLERLRSTFKIQAEYIQEKTWLSSKNKKKWVCECGAKNDEESKWCKACQKDISGFTRYEDHPKHVADLIANKMAVLREQFQTTSDNSPG